MGDPRGAWECAEAEVIRRPRTASGHKQALAPGGLQSPDPNPESSPRRTGALRSPPDPAIASFLGNPRLASAARALSVVARGVRAGSTNSADHCLSCFPNRAAVGCAESSPPATRIGPRLRCFRHLRIPRSGPSRALTPPSTHPWVWREDRRGGRLLGSLPTHSPEGRIGSGIRNGFL